MDFLRLFVGVQLQTDGAFLHIGRVGLAVIDDLLSINHQPDAISLGKNLQVVPIVLLADRFGRSAVDGAVSPPRSMKIKEIPSPMET